MTPGLEVRRTAGGGVAGPCCQHAALVPSHVVEPSPATGDVGGRAVMVPDGPPRESLDLLLQREAPGEVGSLAVRTIEGPARFQFDMNLSKQIRISENRDLEFRADVVNILNHPVFGNPNLNINSANFGQIDAADPGRKFTLGARFNF